MADMTDMTAAQWAAAVPEERFQASRHELDELVVAVVPDYAAAVRREVNRLPSALKEVPAAGPSAAPGRWKRRIHRELTYLSTFTVSAGVVIMFGMRSRGVSVVDAHSVAAALMVVSTLSWAPWVWQARRRRSWQADKTLQYAAGLQALFTVAVAVPMLEAAGRDGMQPSWVVVAVVCAVLSVLLLVTLLRERSRSSGKAADALPQRGLRPLTTATRAAQDRLLDVFERLPDDDRAALRSEHTAAMDVLRGRGLAVTPPGDEPVPGWALLERRATELARAEDAPAGP